MGYQGQRTNGLQVSLTHTHWLQKITQVATLCAYTLVTTSQGCCRRPPKRDMLDGSHASALFTQRLANKFATYEAKFHHWIMDVCDHQKKYIGTSTDPQVGSSHANIMGPTNLCPLVSHNAMNTLATLSVMFFQNFVYSCRCPAAKQAVAETIVSNTVADVW